MNEDNHNAAAAPGGASGIFAPQAQSGEQVSAAGPTARQGTLEHQEAELEALNGPSAVTSTDDEGVSESHAAGGVPPRDTFTILKSISGLASKRIVAQPEGSPTVEGYNAGLLFRVFEAPVRDIVSLSTMLMTVEAQPACLVIRGAPRTDLDRGRPQLRRKTNFQTPETGRWWVLVDFDKVKLPLGVSLKQDIGAVCEHLTGRLPAEFHAASYHWQLSSSAGIADPSIVSLHLWFWLDRPVTDTQLKAWSKRWNAKTGTKVIDSALFNDVQAHYTAPPVFVGMDDPFPVRSGLVRKAVDEVALKLPRSKLPPPSRRTHNGTEPLRPTGGFEHILGQIGDHPDGKGFHLPTIRAIASYVATQGREATDIEVLYEIVRARVLAADRSRHDDAYVEDTASREHIIPAIEQAIQKFGAPSPRRKSRQIRGVRPHFTSKPVAAAEGAAMLQNVFNGFFGRTR